MSRSPRVVVSFAQSVDGRIATRNGDSRWISGSESLTLAHELRRDNDAVLVGIGTVLRDDPELSCRLPDSPQSPLRVVLDSRLRLPDSSCIVRTASHYRTIVATLPGNPAERRLALEKRDVSVLECRQDGSGIDLPHLLQSLRGLGVASVLVEGGSGVITSFVRQSLVDAMLVVMAPLLIGEGTPALGDLGTEALAQAIRLTPKPVRQLGSDLVWELEFPGTA